MCLNRAGDRTLFAEPFHKCSYQSWSIHRSRERSGDPGRLCHDRLVVDGPRFLTLTDVAEVLNISASQTYALVRSGDLAAIKVGGRGQWRIERSQLEDYIARMYAE